MIKKLLYTIYLILISTGCFAQQHFDIILKNGKIIDGAGNPWFYGDVGIVKDKIVSIGDLSKSKADKTIDATGLIIAPGFIDVHTHIEGDEKKTPTADNFIYDGVTTVITGNCGTSNIDIKKYFQFLDNLKLSVNVATLIGHNDVREAVLGKRAITPNDAQLRKMQAIVEQAMRDGAVGFSTGLIYTPGLYSKTPEVVALAKAAAKYHGVYTSHMRNESDKIFDAIAEAIDIGRQANMPVEISHFKVGLPNWNRSNEMIAMVEKAQTEFDSCIFIFVFDMPAIGCFGVFLDPIARSCRAAFKFDVVQALPFSSGQLFAPNRLWFGAYQYNIPKAFQLFKIAAINQLVIFPVRWG